MAAIELYSTSFFNDANLVSYYRMEGNSNDSKDSNNGSDTAISYNASYGKFGQGASLNGTSSLITLNNGSNLKFGTGSFTISAWIYPTNVSAGNQDWIMDAEIAGGWCTIRVGNDGVLHFQIHGTGGDCNFASAAVAFANNTWTHVVCVMDRGTGYGTIYINGAYSNTGAVSGNPTIDQGPWKLGATDLSGIFPVGYIDDVAFFNRVLTAAEVLSLYQTATIAGQYRGYSFFL